MRPLLPPSLSVARQRKAGLRRGGAFPAHSFVSVSSRDVACFAALRRFLEEYQRVPGQVATFLEHMQARTSPRRSREAAAR